MNSRPVKPKQESLFTGPGATALAEVISAVTDAMPDGVPYGFVIQPGSGSLTYVTVWAYGEGLEYVFAGHDGGAPRLVKATRDGVAVVHETFDLASFVERVTVRDMGSRA